MIDCGQVIDVLTAGAAQSATQLWIQDQIKGTELAVGLFRRNRKPCEARGQVRAVQGDGRIVRPAQRS